MKQQLCDLKSRETPVYWDVREELLSCLADLRMKAAQEATLSASDPLAAYCEAAPWEDECRVYDT